MIWGAKSWTTSTICSEPLMIFLACEESWLVHCFSFSVARLMASSRLSNRVGCEFSSEIEAGSWLIKSVFSYFSCQIWRGCSPGVEAFMCISTSSSFDSKCLRFAAHDLSSCNYSNIPIGFHTQIIAKKLWSRFQCKLYQVIDEVSHLQHKCNWLLILRVSQLKHLIARVPQRGALF